MVHGGMKLVKFLLFLFNFIFWFAILLGLMIVLELAAGIAAYVLRVELNCCGAINYTDWESKDGFRTVNLGPKGGRLLPVSCCASATEADSCYTTAENLHTVGCLEQLKKWAEINVGYMGGIGVGLAFIQICRRTFFEHATSWALSVH
uniref:Tetraspanin n=1 Tax=Romanomermis culicivorax TaxID=13658 RepID=A0A915JKM9_ROMCU